MFLKITLAVQGVQGISDIITIPGLVNVDFADVKAVMCNSGTAMLGVGVGEGKNRAEDAAKVCLLNSSLFKSSPITKSVNFFLVSLPACRILCRQVAHHLN